MKGELSFTVDVEGGSATVTGVGMWSPEHIEAHFRELERAVLKLRREHRQVRVLVDLRGADVQTAETVAIMKWWTSRVYRQTDIVAVVCATALLAMQIKRGTEIMTMATFHEIEPAQAWISRAGSPG